MTSSLLHYHFGVFVKEDPKISFPIIIKKEDYSSFGRLFPNRRGTMILPSIGCELYEGRSYAFLVELFIHPRVYISDKVTFIYGVGGYTKFKEDDIIERSLAYSVGFDYKVNDTVNFIYRVYLQGVEPDITKSGSEGGVVSDFSVIFTL